MTKLTNPRFMELWHGIKQKYGEWTFYDYCGMETDDWIMFGVRNEDTPDSAYRKVKRGIQRKIAKKAFGWYMCPECSSTDCEHVLTDRPEDRLVRVYDEESHTMRLEGSSHNPCDACPPSERCAFDMTYYLIDDPNTFNLCWKHLERQYPKYARFVPFYNEKHTLEELRLNYCKRCGDPLDDHDTSVCYFYKYPALMNEFTHEVNIAKDFGIDLTSANEKMADGGLHGAIEGDLNLNICGAIKNYTIDLTLDDIAHYVEKKLKDWDMSFQPGDLDFLRVLRHTNPELYEEYTGHLFVR